MHMVQMVSCTTEWSTGRHIVVVVERFRLQSRMRRRGFRRSMPRGWLGVVAAVVLSSEHCRRCVGPRAEVCRKLARVAGIPR